MSTKEFNELRETRIASEDIFDGAIMHIFRDTVEFPNKNTGIRELMRHIGAVCIVPITSEGEIILERQFRYPLDQVITEIPAGKLDFPEEDRLSAAKRELKEETGYVAERWTDMGLYYPAAAYSDEKITMYLAEGLTLEEQQLDEDEFLNVFKLPLNEAVSKILSGEITDGKTQVAVLKAYEIIRGRHE